MTTPAAARLLQALNALAQHVLGDHRLAAESQRAQREFFQAVDYEPTVVQRQRFLEWYLLEQESLVLGAVPFAVYGSEPYAAPLADSTAGLWVVETAQGERFEARDLQDDEIVELQAPSTALVVGDLVVGRLYQAERSGWQLSPAVAVYRPGHAIAAAFQKDLRRIDLDRRLSQAELEHLLLHRPPAGAPAEAPPVAATAAAVRPAEHIEADLDTLLAAGGCPNRATSLSAALKAATRPGPVLGPLLDQLAFDTKVDLDGARRLLLELWHTHHAADVAVGEVDEPGPSVAPGESLGEQLVRTLDAGLGQHRDLGDLFRQLEEMAGIEPDEADDDALVVGDADDDDDEAAPRRRADASGRPGTDRDAGDLDPLVTEFVWETGGSGSADERVLRTWIELQQNAALPHMWLDQVTGQDLLRLLLHEYLHAEPTRRAAAVQAAHAALERFSRWAESTQELSLQGPLQQCRGPLLEHAERLQQAGLLLSGPSLPGAQPPALLFVEDVDAAGFGVRTEDTCVLVAAPPVATAQLRAGDLLLGAIATNGRQTRLSGMVVALPADAEALMS